MASPQESERLAAHALRPLHLLLHGPGRGAVAAGPAAAAIHTQDVLDVRHGCGAGAEWRRRAGEAGPVRPLGAAPAGSERPPGAVDRRLRSSGVLDAPHALQPMTATASIRTPRGEADGWGSEGGNAPRILTKFPMLSLRDRAAVPELEHVGV